MNTFFPPLNKQDSLKSLVDRLPKETGPLLIALSIISLAIAVFASTFSQTSPQTQSSDEIIWKEHDTLAESVQEEDESSDIYVDVSGAVENPDMYKLPSSARLTQAVQKAGGLTQEADTAYYYRNFNLAKTLEDQEKIYVPSHLEIQTGLFAENSRLLQYFPENQSEPSTEVVSEQTDSTKISINAASQTELETLPGVGPVTASKIINNRPYTTLEDLKTTKVVGEATYSKIEDMIAL